MLRGGAAASDITPKDSQFLFGYPHVERYSTGVHDPLLSSALYLANDASGVLFVANDIIFVSKALTEQVRRRISEKTGLTPQQIMISATHTHSGPITVNYISNEADPTVPKVDPGYLRVLENGIVESAVKAHAGAEPVELGWGIADGSSVGTNRRDPKGPADPNVPVLMVRSANGERSIGCMLICSMHPTVLHEDSTLVSGDFPGLARRYLQTNAVGTECPVLLQTGPCGNQSPRHVTRANTFEEADRLGSSLGKSVAEVIREITYKSDLTLDCQSGHVDLPPRTLPPVTEAQARLDAAREKLDRMRRENAPVKATRTAECDWFGAEESLTLARAQENGRLDEVRATCMPAEIQVIRVGDLTFVGWPGEVFIEYALTVKRAHPDTSVISMANGELQGYIVTPEAQKQGGYESSNALFDAAGGEVLVRETDRLLKAMRDA